MRKHRVIRQVIVPHDIAEFAFDIETGQFDNIMVTWDNSAGDLGPTGIVLCPTQNRPSPLTTNANFPGLPAVPAAGAVAYASLGVNGRQAFPMPDMITIGVIQTSGQSLTIKVEGDEHVSKFPDPSEDYKRSRA